MLEVFPAHEFVRDPDDLDPAGREPLISGLILFTSLFLVVHGSVEFDPERQLPAEEVEDEAADRKLSFELQSKTPLRSKHLPRSLFSRSGFLPELLRECP